MTIQERATPRYATIEQELRQRIDRGIIRPGDPLPPEIELSRDFGVSRHTIRRALESLQRSGLIARRPGRGTVVTRPPLLTQPLGGFYTFVGSAVEQGHLPRSIILEQEVRAARGPTAEKLGLPPGEKVIRLVRQRLVDEIPLILETTEIPYHLCPPLATTDPGDRSLYDLLEELGGIVVSGATETIRPVVLSARQARLLGVPARSAAFHVERLTLAGELTVEWRRSLIRGDRYLYAVDLPRLSSGQPDRYP
jgi:GntR family transcriptional regulator